MVALIEKGPRALRDDAAGDEQRVESIGRGGATPTRGASHRWQAENFESVAVRAMREGDGERAAWWALRAARAWRAECEQ